MIGRHGQLGLFAACAMMACGWLCGCKGGGRTPLKTGVTAETRLSVHDLTRVSIDADDRGELRVHVALSDAEGGAIRPLGVFKVSLYRPADPGAGGAQKLDKFWEVDLRDPVKNAAAYDGFITRTYVLELRDVPEWVRQWARGDAGSGIGPTLVVEFFTDGASGVALREGVQMRR
ncbi:MAG: hypothetical protein K2W85_01350 [Phycisphaerales bacterium]|nr:hypothetical protein [Phycisphaerales bacterium]